MLPSYLLDRKLEVIKHNLHQIHLFGALGSIRIPISGDLVKYSPSAESTESIDATINLIRRIRNEVDHGYASFRCIRNNFNLSIRPATLNQALEVKRYIM